MQLPFLNSLLKSASKYYKRAQARELAKFGLKYEDILVDTPLVQRAAQWLPKEEMMNRNRRLVRAIDLGLKRVDLPENLQAMQRPYDFYLQKNLKEAEALHLERKELMS